MGRSAKRIILKMNLNLEKKVEQSNDDSQKQREENSFIQYKKDNIKLFRIK